MEWNERDDDLKAKYPGLFQECKNFVNFNRIDILKQLKRKLRGD